MTSRRTRVATIFAAAALGASGLGVIAGPASANPTPNNCDKTRWAADVQGINNGYKAGAANGDYLWHSNTGFHLRVTHGNNNDRRIYTGEIDSDAKLNIRAVRLEKGDYVKLSNDKHTLLFLFSNHGFIDGVDFNTHCASQLVVKNLRIGNNNLGADRVFLGADGSHPAQIPFTITREPAPGTGA